MYVRKMRKGKYNFAGRYMLNNSQKSTHNRLPVQANWAYKQPERLCYAADAASEQKISNEFTPDNDTKTSLWTTPKQKHRQAGLYV